MSIKDRSATEDKLIRAIGEVIAQHGFAKVGVNAVARQAGVDKVLIYRYFDGLDGLIKAYANSGEFWPKVDELLGDESQREALRELPFTEVYSLAFRRYLKAIRARPLTIEILAWETIERNALTIVLEEVREEFGLQMLEIMQSIDVPPGDWQAIANIFTGAIHYLAIRARKIKFFSGMDLTDDDEWERLSASIEFLITQSGRNTDGK